MTRIWSSSWKAASCWRWSPALGERSGFISSRRTAKPYGRNRRRCWGLQSHRSVSKVCIIASVGHGLQRCLGWTRTIMLVVWRQGLEQRDQILPSSCIIHWVMLSVLETAGRNLPSREWPHFPSSWATAQNCHGVEWTTGAVWCGVAWCGVQREGHASSSWHPGVLLCWGIVPLGHSAVLGSAALPGIFPLQIKGSGYSGVSVGTPECVMCVMWLEHPWHGMGHFGCWFGLCQDRYLWKGEPIPILILEIHNLPHCKKSRYDSHYCTGTRTTIHPQHHPAQSHNREQGLLVLPLLSKWDQAGYVFLCICFFFFFLSYFTVTDNHGLVKTGGKWIMWNLFYSILKCRTCWLGYLHCLLLTVTAN